MEVHPFGGEAFQPGTNPAVGVAGDRSVSRIHRHPIGIPVCQIAERAEHHPRAAEQFGRRQKRSDHRDAEDGGDTAGSPAQPGDLEPAALSDGFAAADRLFDHERCELLGIPGPGPVSGSRRGSPELHAADHGLPERPVVLLDIERDLAVAHPGPEGPHHESPRGEREQCPGAKREGAHEPGRVAQRLDGNGGDRKHDERRTRHRRDPGEEPPGPPPGAHPTNHPKQVLRSGSGRGAAQAECLHSGTSPCSDGSHPAV